MTKTSPRSRDISVGIVIILLIAFWLRVHQLDAQSLWLDEAFTFAAMTDLFSADTLAEAHLASYYITTSPWYTILPPEFGIRWPSVLAGIMIVALVYRIATALGSHQVSIVATLLVAVNPTQLRYAQEARSYALATMLALLILIATMQSQRRSVSLVLIIVPCLMVLVNALMFLWIVPVLGFLMILRWHSGEGIAWNMLWPAVASTIAGLGGIIAIDQFIIPDRLQRVLDTESFWQSAVPGADELASLLAHTIGMRFRQQNIIGDSIVFIVVLGVLILMIAGGLWLAFQHSWNSDETEETSRLWQLLLLIVAAVGQPILLFGISNVVQPLWSVKYMLPSVTVMMILIIYALAQYPRFTAFLVSGLLIASSLVMVSRYYTDPAYQNRDWRGLVHHIALESAPDDIVLICAGSRSVPIAVYLSRIMDEPPLIWWSQADEVDSALENTFDQNGTVWVMPEECPQEGSSLDIPSLANRDHTRVQFNKVDLWIYK